MGRQRETFVRSLDRHIGIRNLIFVTLIPPPSDVISSTVIRLERVLSSTETRSPCASFVSVLLITGDIPRSVFTSSGRRRGVVSPRSHNDGSTSASSTTTSSSSGSPGFLTPISRSRVSPDIEVSDPSRVHRTVFFSRPKVPSTSYSPPFIDHSKGQVSPQVSPSFITGRPVSPILSTPTVSPHLVSTGVQTVSGTVGLPSSIMSGYSVFSCRPVVSGVSSIGPGGVGPVSRKIPTTGFTSSRVSSYPSFPSPCTPTRLPIGRTTDTITSVTTSLTDLCLSPCSVSLPRR